MKVRIVITNDQNQVEYDYEHQKVEHIEIGALVPMRFDQVHTGKFLQCQASEGFHGHMITLVLPGNLPHHVPQEIIQVPIEKP